MYSKGIEKSCVDCSYYLIPYPRENKPTLFCKNFSHNRGLGV